MYRNVQINLKREKKGKKTIIIPFDSQTLSNKRDELVRSHGLQRQATFGCFPFVFCFVLFLGFTRSIIEENF